MRFRCLQILNLLYQFENSCAFIFYWFPVQKHSRPQSPSFLGRLQIKPSGSGDENGTRERFNKADQRNLFLRWRPRQFLLEHAPHPNVKGQNASCRVRSDFWMQNFRDFFQKQAGIKLLFHDALQKYRRDWIRFDQNENNSTYKALTVSKKKIKTFYHISRLYLHFPGMENYWANFKSFSRIQDSLRTLELSDCVLRIPFIRRGRPIECWLHTYQACAKATWRLGLRLFWSHAITIKIYLQIIFICCVSKTVRKIKVKIVPWSPKSSQKWCVCNVRSIR